MAQQIRLTQEGFVRAQGFQLTQWTSAYPAEVTTDSLENLFVITKSSLGESLVRVATLTDFVSYNLNELKYFECRGVNGNFMHGALAGDILRVTPSVSYWLQAAAPYADCDFVVSGFETVSGSSPQIMIGNYLQLSNYTFTDADVGRWFVLAGFATTAYNATAQVTAVVSPHTAVIAFYDGTSVTTNETGTSWVKRRIVIQTNVSSTLEPRYFPTVERGIGWALERGGSTYMDGPTGESSRRDPRLVTFRDRRVTSLLPSLDAAMNLVTTTKAAVAHLQAESDTNNTAFLGAHQTDYPQ